MSARRRRAEAPTALLPFDGAPAAGPERRVFLGWSRPPLESAAEWLLAERCDAGKSIGLLVALPGSRACRRLWELLARRAPRGWHPPRLLTQGELVDALVLPERPAAGRLARTLAWRRALEALPERELARIARGAWRRRTVDSRLRLAETVRKLHGVLAPEGLDFEALARAGFGPDHELERERWAALARAQAIYRKVLAAEDLCDPHEGRRAAIDAGRVDKKHDVVLVGIADMNRLLARTVEALGARATALVAAPRELAEGFDAIGRLVPPFWARREVPVAPIAIERWFVEEKPSDQADRVATLLADWSLRRAADEITIGLADREVAPYLERRLRAAGARMRDAAGTPLARTRPYRLLSAAARFLERRGFSEFATLARHPDVVQRLADAPARAPADAPRRDPAEVLDRYHAEHLPGRVFESDAEDWPGDAQATRGVRAVHRRLCALLGELADGRSRPLAAWAEPVRALLTAVFGAAPLDPAVEDERVVAGALAAIGGALEELGELPPGLSGSDASAHEALALLLRHLRGAAVAPAPPKAHEPTVEALGWLELPLDDAPALVVAGFNEGRVPEAVQGDGFLPDSLRAKLGLADDRARLARDVYATSVLVASRPDVAFVTGRRSRDGDPLVPSRIAFHGAGDDVIARVRRFLPPPARPEPPESWGREREAAPLPLARLAATPRVERMSVTSFDDYLKSPYLFYLRRVVCISPRDDRARELDPLRFGTFAHAVVQEFGRGEARDSPLADVVEAALIGHAERLAREAFGKTPLPAAALQLEQLKHRLRRFARIQARRAAQGWRVHAVEWRPEDGVPFEVDGEPIRLTGRIDRIDVHPEKGWAILDYKTSERGTDPADARAKDGTWRSLQLPLYRLLAAPLALESGLTGPPAVGYVTLAKDEDDIAFNVAGDWTEEDFEEAYEAARNVVRAVRRGELFELGSYEPLEEDLVLSALFGRGLLHRPIAEGAESADGGDGAEGASAEECR